MNVTRLTGTARHALEMACCFSTQLQVIPATQSLPGLQRLYREGLLPMSHPVLTAAGAAEVMQHTRPTLPVLAVLVRSMGQALELGKIIPFNVSQMSHGVVSDSYAPLVAAAVWWTRRITPPLEEALALLQHSLEPAAWQHLIEIMQQAEPAQLPTAPWEHWPSAGLKLRHQEDPARHL